MEVLCEYLKNPLGIDVEAPVFSWIVENFANGEKQTAYRVQVSKEMEFKENVVWDSQDVESEETANIPYEGLTLESAEVYYYRVIVKTSQNRKLVSEIGRMCTGLIGKEWDADFIGGSLMERHTFWFRHEFSLSKAVKKAIVYIASPNYYVFTVNGSKVTDAVLNNAWTDPEKTLLYATYSVEDFLTCGGNAFGVEVGNGWNALELGYSGEGKGEHLFSLYAVLHYEDGTKEMIKTDNQNWFFTVDGPVTMNSIYEGEDYDARKEMEGWDKAGYDMASAEAVWQDAVEYEPPEGKIKSQLMEQIKVVDYRIPEIVYHLEDGSYVYDMGQNFAGWVRLKVKAARGTKIVMRYSEMLNSDKTLNCLSIRKIRAADTYICKGNGEEVYEPSFTYHGFRYVQVEGLTEEPPKDTITGCVVHSAVEKIGSFECSNAIVNQIQSNIQWSESSNLYGVPTDCPQRDERLGWLNDMTVRNECALYNYGLISLYKKWLGDIRDTQGIKTGAISDTAPFRKFGQRPADPVSGSFALIPWNVYCHYGDVRILEENYEPLKKWVEYLVRNTREYIVKYSPMGDWAAPIGNGSADSYGGGALSKVTPTQQMGTGFLYYDLMILKKIAEVLGKKEDLKRFEKLADKVKTAFNKTYYNEEKKYYARNSQASNILPLYLKMTDSEDREEILNHVIKNIVETNDTHLTTGNLCTRYAIEVLMQEGYEDIAYQLISQTSYPSWGFMVIKGATTIWERWEEAEADSPIASMASLNHPMNGAVGVVYYKYLAGICPDEKDPGFKKIQIRPVVPEKLNHVSASVNTIRGTVHSEWTQEKDRFSMKVKVPFGSTAKLYIPVGNLQKSDITIRIDDVEAVQKGEVIEEYQKLSEWEEKYWCIKVESGWHEIIRSVK